MSNSTCKLSPTESNSSNEKSDLNGISLNNKSFNGSLGTCFYEPYWRDPAFYKRRFVSSNKQEEKEEKNGLRGIFF